MWTLVEIFKKSLLWNFSVFFNRRNAITGRVTLPAGAEKTRVEIHASNRESGWEHVSSNTIEKKRDAKIFLHLTLMIKRSTTETFCIAFEVNFLTMQLIYKGKTTLSLSKVKSLKRFRWVSMRAITVTKKSLKLLVEIVLHYITQTWDGLGLPVTQKAFLIYDVFRRRTITFHRFPWQQEHLRHQSFT